MGMIEDLAAYQLAHSTAFVAGESLFINEMPETTGAAAVLAEYPGDVIDTYGAQLPPIERAEVVAVTRSTAPAFGLVPSSTSAKRLAHSIYQTLSLVGDVASTSSGRRFYAVTALSGPYYAGQDERARLLFQQSFNVWHRPSSND